MNQARQLPVKTDEKNEKPLKTKKKNKNVFNYMEEICLWLKKMILLRLTKQLIPNLYWSSEQRAKEFAVQEHRK